MTEYRRFYYPGATWFFTVNLAERRGNQLLMERIDVLREAFVSVKNKHPFKIDAIMILPEHLHCILTLPEGDGDFSTRWGLIKAYFFPPYRSKRTDFQKPEKPRRKRFMATAVLGTSYP